MSSHPLSDVESPITDADPPGGGSGGGGSGGPADDGEQTDLLGMLRLPDSYRSCCDTLWFLLITLLLLLDLLTDLGVLVLYAIDRHYVFLATSAGVFVVGSALGSCVYGVQMRQHAGHGALRGCGCLLANCPLRCGQVGHRFMHAYHSSGGASGSVDGVDAGVGMDSDNNGSRVCCSCCCRQPSHQPWRAKQQNNLRWVFIKLDLIHGMVNCAPQIVINVLYMLHHGGGEGRRHAYMLQYVSVATSFGVLLLASVLHEKLRKERARNSPYGCMPMMCILVYRSLVLAARLLAFAVFIHYFGPLIVGVVVPHLILVLAFFTYLYRQVWKVPYYKIFTNSFYCILAYYPIHCEYRPEGEIVMYYILYLVENIVMVGLAYVHQPLLSSAETFAPWSDFHKTATLLVLLWSSIGLTFMGTYYFFFHGANESISDTNLSWLAKVCEWTKRRSKSIPHRVGLYTSQINSASTPTSFANPLYQERIVSSPPPPTTITTIPSSSAVEQPQPLHLAIVENVTSPLWNDPPRYSALYPPDKATTTEERWPELDGIRREFDPLRCEAGTADIYVEDRLAALEGSGQVTNVESVSASIEQME